MTDRRPLSLYRHLLDYYGPQYWWPAETDLEMMVGAVLTQAVNWENASKAITNLKEEGVLNLSSLQEISLQDLSQLIKPSGYYRIKARRLKSLLSFIHREWQGDITRLKEGSLYEHRSRLLKVWGLGPETVDAILLYAGGYPIFVVDTYTIRILGRLGLLARDSSYTTVQRYFMQNLPEDVHLFSSYHALLVVFGKDLCKKEPCCQDCFLQDLEKKWRERGP